MDFYFSSVCQAPFVSNKSVSCAKHSNLDAKLQESMPWLLAFDYSVGVSGATCSDLKTRADLLGMATL